MEEPRSDPPLQVLVARCLQSDDPDLWEPLVRCLQPLFARMIYRVASSVGTARMDEVDDLVQECFLKLKGMRLGSIRQAVFDNEQAALAYFRVLAANTARDYFRSKNAEKRGVAQTTSVDDRLDEIAGSHMTNPNRGLLIGQIDNMLSADSQGRTIFWLYYRQGFTAKEIADIPAFKLTAKGVESLIRRLTISVRQKINSAQPEGNLGRKTF